MFPLRMCRLLYENCFKIAASDDFILRIETGLFISKIFHQIVDHVNVMENRIQFFFLVNIFMLYFLSGTLNDNSIHSKIRWNFSFVVYLIY